MSEESLDSISIQKDTLYPEYGLFGGYNFNYHFIDFRTFPGVPSCCEKFNNSFGDGFNAGLFYEYPLRPLVGLHFKAGVNHTHGYLERNEREDVIVDGQLTDGIFSHQASFWLTNIIFQPTITYEFYPNLTTNAHIGFSYLYSSNYSQIERITEPTDRGTFSDGRRFRNDSSGVIPNVNNINLAAGLGLSYMLPLDKKGTLFLSPEINLDLYILPVVKEYKWNYLNLSAGVSLVYRKPPPPPPPPAPPQNPPVPQIDKPEAPPYLSADIKVYEVDENGNEKEDFDIEVEDFISLNMRPLLNYVFFDKGSSEIPGRYKRISQSQANDFNINELKNLNALNTYYHVLNIYGKRLKENSNVSITLLGSNSDESIEEDNLELSRNRAEAVRDYLNDVWQISENRMKIEARNLPREANTSDEPGALEENRRVEIIASDPVLAEPVFTSDTIRAVSSKKLKIDINFNTNTELTDWRLDIVQQDSLLKSFSSYPVKESETIYWTIAETGQSSPKYNGNIQCILTAKNDIGMEKKIRRDIPIKRLTVHRKRMESKSDMEYEYYSLILFDFGSSKLEKAHRQVIDFVKQRITPGAKVYIYGYSDSMGDEETNLRLSERRARAVAERLKIEDATVNAIGEGDLLYNNQFPEGRFYCRTVTITIETPIQNK